MSSRRKPTKRELDALGGNVQVRNRQMPSRFPPAPPPEKRQRQRNGSKRRKRRIAAQAKPGGS